MMMSEAEGQPRPPSGDREQPVKAMISVVIPVRDEAENIEEAVSRTAAALRETGMAQELIVVDDGSRDGTFPAALSLRERFPSLKVIRFSRNFGKEAALLAGLKAAGGEVVVTLDADLQHPPEIIPAMLASWRKGAKVVHGTKQVTGRATGFSRACSAFFNNLFRLLSGIDLRRSSDYKLLDRTVVDVLVTQLPELYRFYRGLAQWLGFEQAWVPFPVEERNRGRRRFSLLKRLDLALTAIVSFSTAPLRIVTVLALLTLLVALPIAADALWSWYRGDAVSGFATLIGTILIMGSFIMISLGIIGEYLIKIYGELKARPLYIVSATAGFDEPAPARENKQADSGRPGPNTL